MLASSWCVYRRLQWARILILVPRCYLQHIMPLIYVLIKLLNDLVAKVANQRHRSAEDMREIEALAMSCITVFVAFDDRLRELSRGWRLEAKDIGMQVDRYADGLFKKYYAEVCLG